MNKGLKQNLISKKITENNLLINQAIFDKKDDDYIESLQDNQYSLKSELDYLENIED